MSKPTIRRRNDVWEVHDGMITRPASSWQEAHSILAARKKTMCLHANCWRQRGTNPYGVCDVHAPAPVPNRLAERRIAQLEISHHLRSAA